MAVKLSSKFVVFHFAQSMEDGRSGSHGVRVLLHAEQERKFEQEIVTIRLQVMAAHIVRGIIVKVLSARFNHVQVINIVQCDLVCRSNSFLLKLMVVGQTGLLGRCAAKRAGKVKSIEDENAIRRNR